MHPDRNKSVCLFISATLGAEASTRVRLGSCVSEQSGPGSGRAIAGDGNTAVGDELIPALLQPLPGACLWAAFPAPAQQ